MIFNIQNIFKKEKEENTDEQKYKIRDFRDIYFRPYNEDPENVIFKLKEAEDKKNIKYVDVKIKDFVEDIKNLGNGLEDLGFHKDLKVGLITNNRYEWPLVYLSITSGIGKMVPLDFALPEDELIKSINRIKLDAIFYTKKHHKLIMKLIDKNLTPSIKHYIFIDNVRTKEEESKILDEIKKYNKENENKKAKEKKEENKIHLNNIKSIMEHGSKKSEEEKLKFFEKEIDINEDAIYSFTSATTSEAKIVILSQKNICENMAGINDRFTGFNKEDTMLSFLSIHHSFESTVGQLYPISVGAKIAYADSLRTVGKNIKEYGTTSMIVVPAVMDVIHKKLFEGIKKQNKLKEFALGKAASNTLLKFGVDKRRQIFKSVLDAVGPDLRLVVTGAAALSPKVQKDLNDIGIKVIQGYGLTETSPVVAAGNPSEDVVYGSVGRPLKGVEVKIDEPGEDGIGEILLKGLSVSRGYLNNKEANENSFNGEGYFRTGDLGYLDKEGNLYISGRIKNVIVLKNGKNVFPEESQILIDKIPGVLESFVFGYNKENPKDPKIVAKIVYDEEFFEGKTKDEIHEYLWNEIKKINRKQPAYKYVKDILITNEPLIRTTTRKIKLYEELKVATEAMVSAGK